MVDEIKEAFEVANDTEKRLIFFDDFLGQVRLSSDFVRGTDQRFPPFVQRIKASKNLRFILTTPEYILRQAQAQSTRLSGKEVNASEFILNVGFYTREVRAKILYNHIFFSDLSQSERDIDEIKSVSSSLLEYGVDENGAITSIREAIVGHVADLSSTLSSIGSIEELDYYEKDLNKLLDDYGLHNRRLEETFEYRREALIEKESYDDKICSSSQPTGARNITNEEIKSMFSGLRNS